MYRCPSFFSFFFFLYFPATILFYVASLPFVKLDFTRLLVNFPDGLHTVTTCLPIIRVHFLLVSFDFPYSRRLPRIKPPAVLLFRFPSSFDDSSKFSFSARDASHPFLARKQSYEKKKNKKEKEQREKLKPRKKESLLDSFVEVRSWQATGLLRYHHRLFSTFLPLFTALSYHGYIGATASSDKEERNARKFRYSRPWLARQAIFGRSK